jgi:L-lactate dehydrogenase
MSKIAIIGAGDVGTTIAYTVQLRGLATEIVLVDVNHELVQGQVMDLNHGLFFVRPVHIYAGDYADCTDADVIVLTAGARQKPGESRLQLVSRNARLCKEIVEKIDYHNFKGIFLIVTNPVDVMTRVIIEYSGLPHHRVIGSGTVLDSARFRYCLSRNCQVDARNVHAYVIGEHGDSEVLLWSQAHIGGTPLEVFCKQCAVACNTAVNREKIDEAVRRSAYHIIEAKGATNYGISLAVRRILEAIIRDEHSMLTVSTWLSGNYGLSDICLSVPCIISRAGVTQVIETRLDSREEALLVTSAEILSNMWRKMDSGLMRSNS